VPEATLQTELFESVLDLPEGMRFVAGVISPGEERALLDKLPGLLFKDLNLNSMASSASAAPSPSVGIMISTAAD
jgi:hypothetical protein